MSVEENNNTENNVEENLNSNKNLEENNSNENNKSEDDVSSDVSQKDTDKNNNENDGEPEEKVFTSAKDSTGGAFDTLELTKELTKIETILENKKSNTPDVKDFYKNIDNYLSDEDKQLYFEDDKSAYFEAIEKAKEDFLNNQKIDTTEEEQQLEAIKGKFAVANAIESVLKEPGYQDFNFIKLQQFYNEELTGKERAELNKNSTVENLPEQFKKVYDLYKKKNPINIKKVEDPKIPDASTVSKTSIEDKKEIDNKKQDEKYKESIGFRKL